MPERDDFLKTVEAVHAAAIDDARWPVALQTVANLFGARVGSYEVFDSQKIRLRELRTCGLPPLGEVTYLEHYSHCNTRALYAFRNPREDILWDRRLIDERGMDRDPYYAKYLAPLGLRYFMTGKLIQSADTHAIISIQRTKKEGHVSRGDVERMRKLLPHLRQAYDVAARLGSAAERSGALERALDWLIDGTFIVRGDSTVMYANGAAQAIARGGDSIRIVRGQIEFKAGTARAQFAAALGQTIRLAGGEHAPAAHDFAVEREAAPPYLVSVRPLFGGRQRPSATLAVVFVHDPLQRDASTVELLRGIFGLTEAEASLARALQEGVPLAEYARAHRLSLNTVYTHLRRIKEKTHTKRQAELIHRLNDLRLMLRPVSRAGS